MKTQLVYRDTGNIQNGFKTVITAGFAEFPLDAELPDEKKIISLTDCYCFAALRSRRQLGA